MKNDLKHIPEVIELLKQLPSEEVADTIEYLKNEDDWYNEKELQTKYYETLTFLVDNACEFDTKNIIKIYDLCPDMTFFTDDFMIYVMELASVEVPNEDDFEDISDFGEKFRNNFEKAIWQLEKGKE